MPFIDNKGRILGKVSIVDILIIALLAGAVGMGIYKMRNLNPQTFYDETEILVKVQSKNAPEAAFDAIEIGSVFREEKSKQVFGTTVSKEKLPAEAHGQAADGSFVKTTLPGRYDIILVLKCKAKKTESGYTVAGQDLRISADYTLKDDRVQQRFYVLEIKE